MEEKEEKEEKHWILHGKHHTPRHDFPRGSFEGLDSVKLE
jgi:hypothetical protein